MPNPPTPTTKSPKHQPPQDLPQAARALLALLLAGPFVLLFFLGQSHLALSFDSYVYLLLAQSLAQGEGFYLGGSPHAFFSPAYPALIALISLSGISTVWAAQGLSAFCLSLSIALMVWLAWRAWGSWQTGLLAAGLLLASGRVQQYGLTVWAENLLAPLYLAAVLCALPQRGKLGSASWYGLSGFMAAAWYGKPEGLVIFLGLWLGKLFSPALDASAAYWAWPGRRTWLHAGLALLLFVSLLIPGVAWNAQATGKLALSPKKNAILLWAHEVHTGGDPKWALREAPPENPCQDLGEYYRRLVRLPAQSFDYSWTEIADNALSIPIEYGFKYFGPLTGLLVLGSCVLLLRRKASVLRILFIPTALIYAYSIVLYDELRFFLPVLPLLCLQAAFLVQSLAHRLGGMRGARRMWAMLLLILCLITEGPGWWALKEPAQSPLWLEPPAELTAAVQTGRVASNHAGAAYLTGAKRMIMIPSLRSPQALWQFTQQCQVHTVLLITDGSVPSGLQALEASPRFALQARYPIEPAHGIELLVAHPSGP